MTVIVEGTKNLCASVVNNFYANAQRLDRYISSELDYYISRQEEPVELVSFTEEEKANLTAPSFGNPKEVFSAEDIFCPERVISLSNVNHSFIAKVMNLWNRYTGLSYLSGKLDTLSQSHNIHLYTCTSKLLFKENDSTIRKTIQILSSLFGITHISLAATLLMNNLFFASLKRE